MNSSWCSMSSSSNTSARAPGRRHRSMISSPSSWSSSTRSRSGRVQARQLAVGMRSLATHVRHEGSMLSQSTIDRADVPAEPPGSSLRKTALVEGRRHDLPGSVDLCQFDLVRPIKRRDQVDEVAAEQVLASSSSPGRRSNRRRSTRSPTKCTRPARCRRSCEGTNRSRRRCARPDRRWRMGRSPTRTINPGRGRSCRRWSTRGALTRSRDARLRWPRRATSLPRATVTRRDRLLLWTRANLTAASQPSSGFCATFVTGKRPGRCG